MTPRTIFCSISLLTVFTLFSQATVISEFPWSEDFSGVLGFHTQADHVGGGGEWQVDQEMQPVDRYMYVGTNDGTPTQYAFRTHAWIDMSFPDPVSAVGIGFDFKGSSVCGTFLRAWLVPASYTPDPQTTIQPTGSGPTGRVQIGKDLLALSMCHTHHVIAGEYGGHTMRLVFEYGNGSGQVPIIDNILVEIENIPPPEPLSVTFVDDRSVGLAWPAVGPGQAYYSTQVFRDFSLIGCPDWQLVTEVTAAEDHVSIPDLPYGDAQYAARVRTQLTQTEFGAWSEPVQFRTVPRCGNGVGRLGMEYYLAGVPSDNEQHTMTIRPEVAGEAVRLDFDPGLLYPEQRLLIHDGPDPNAPVLVELNATAPYALYPAFEVVSSHYTGALTLDIPGRVDYGMISEPTDPSGSWYALVTCVPYPDCQPWGLDVQDLHEDAVTLDWHCVACPGSYVLELGPSGYEPGLDENPMLAGTVWHTPTKPFTITGLSPATTYEAYIRTECDGTFMGWSDNSAPVTFTTIGAVGLEEPYQENDWKAVPNPAREMFRVMHGDASDVSYVTPLGVELRDMQGRLVLSVGWETALEGVRIGHLGSGAYLMEPIMRTGVARSKLLVVE
ncbi:MAG: fibronectin type III domain-containing protein [Flavobacteriales bacterium]